MHKLITFCRKGKEPALMVATLLTLVLLLTSPSAASVNTWEFSPQNPVPGDTLDVKGSASPGEDIDLFVIFEKTVPVSEGKFEYILDGVKIPGGFNNFFTVEARGAKDLNVRVKMLIWMTKSSGASGDTATVSQSRVPPGTYTIKIDGDAKEGASDVKLRITAFQGIEADSKGDFSYSYDTNAVPPGDFKVRVGGITKTVTIKSEGMSGDLPGSVVDSPSSGSSSANTGSSTSATSKTPEENTAPKALTPYENSRGDNTNSSLKPETSSMSGENNVSKVLTPDENSGDETPRTQLSKESSQKSENSRFCLDKFYLLIGLGAAVLILIIYSRRK
ncbi:MAG TPA: hypothetical protein VN278_03760 [Methanosarcina sp.]|nr:hypothetical protein [Methanosarcina sp.]